MLEQKIFEISSTAVIRDLVARHLWATLVSDTSAGLRVSHLPVLAEDGEPVVVVGHLARPDGMAHELGACETVLIVQGPHGYLSPTRYEEMPHLPTWNFVTAHLYGRA